MVRQVFDVAPGRRMEYELFLPPNYDPAVPMPFLVSISGSGQQHVNGFSHRLPHGSWALAVPLRPAEAPLLFEGNGVEGDGLWYVREFCRHLLQNFAVELGRFLLVGVSNGGNAVLRFAINYRELCRGLVIVTTGINGHGEDLQRLRGLPIDMYVGNCDECGFFEPMLELERSLRSVGHVPPATLTVFEDAGHCCSPLIDQHLIIAKICIILLHSGQPGRRMKLSVPEPGLLSTAEISDRLRSFSHDLNLECEVDTLGKLHLCLPEIALAPRPAGAANVLFTKTSRRSHVPQARQPFEAQTPVARPEQPPTFFPQQDTSKRSPPMLPIAVRIRDAQVTSASLCSTPTACGGKTPGTVYCGAGGVSTPLFGTLCSSSTHQSPMAHSINPLGAASPMAQRTPIAMTPSQAGYALSPKPILDESNHSMKFFPQSAPPLPPNDAAARATALAAAAVRRRPGRARTEFFDRAF